MRRGVGLSRVGLVLDGDKLTRVGSVALLIRMRLHHLRPKTLRPGQESIAPQIHLAETIRPCMQPRRYSLPSASMQTQTQDTRFSLQMAQVRLRALSFPSGVTANPCQSARYSDSDRAAGPVQPTAPRPHPTAQASPRSPAPSIQLRLERRCIFIP
jgi:hypothetical protein